MFIKLSLNKQFLIINLETCGVFHIQQPLYLTFCILFSFIFKFKVQVFISIWVLCDTLEIDDLA